MEIMRARRAARGVGQGIRHIVALCALIGALAPPQVAAEAQIQTSDQRRVAYVPGSTQKVCQLTGDFDRPWNRPTLSQTSTRAGVLATDLGSSFEHKGKLCFLFGDTWGRKGDRDALACATSRDPERIKLEFLKGPDGKWLPFSVPGISQGAFEIPSYGVSIGDDMYVVFTTDHSKEKTMGRSVLAVSHDDGRTFERLYDLSAAKFINVALWKRGEWLYVFGSGKYRASSVCLARIRQCHVRRKDMLRYFAGVNDEGAPVWSPDEGDALALFRHDVVGEFSVAFCEPLERFLMLYNSTKPRGIMMRSARQPWGEWSEATVIFQPFRDKGYGHFMHLPPGFQWPADSFHDPNRRKVWGGEYGPYLMARYTSCDAGTCRIFYTMSTWNPYQVVIMRSDVQLAPGPEPPEQPRTQP